MAITRWDPVRELMGLLNMQERINRLLDENLGGERRSGEELRAGAWSPPVDIYETEENIVLKAELPGLEIEDVSVEVDDNVLSLKGERKLDETVRREEYHRMERAYGSFRRSFTLPAVVVRENIRAKLKNGVLEVILPKEEKEKPKQIKVDVL